MISVSQNHQFLLKSEAGMPFVYLEIDGQARRSISNNYLALKAREWEAGPLISLPGPPADFPYGPRPIRLTLPGPVNSSVKYMQEFVQETTIL